MEIINFKDVSEIKLNKGEIIADLHGHLIGSSLNDVKKLSKGIDVLAITQHNKLTRFNGEKIVFIPSEEIKTRFGDIIALGIKKTISNELSVSDIINEIHKQGGLAVMPHPFDFLFGLARKIKNKGLIKKFDCIEIWNHGTHEKLNKKAMEFYKKFNLVPLSSSDWHSPRFTGGGLTVIKANKNMNSILKAIKQGKVRLYRKEENFYVKKLKSLFYYSLGLLKKHLNFFDIV